MKHEGRGVIRIDDKTDHGGWVIAASSGTVVMGKVAALADDMTYCPKVQRKICDHAGWKRGQARRACVCISRRPDSMWRSIDYLTRAYGFEQ